MESNQPKFIMYKLLSQNMTSHIDTIWEIGVPQDTFAIEGNTLCTNQVLHCYSDPRLAIIFNLIHTNIKNPRLFKIETTEIVATDGLKFATKQQTLLEELQIPHISTETRIHFAILCALQVHHDERYTTWAANWIAGIDRTNATAYAAEIAAYAAACAATAYAAKTAEIAAKTAACAAAKTAYAAACAAACAAAAAYTTTNTTNIATANAAANAARADTSLDFISILDSIYL